MKKRLIWLLSIFYTFTGLFAQQIDSSQRLKFMGKSMNCSMSAMATHLQTKGYKIEDTKKDMILMKGTFQGYLNCYFVLRKEYNILSFCRIALLDDDFDKSWEELESAYNDIVYRYTQKYGAPQISESNFTGNLLYSNYEKLDLVKNDKCNYYCIFFIEGGTITIYIDSSQSIFITYKDGISTDKIEKMRQDEL